MRNIARFVIGQVGVILGLIGSLILAHSTVLGNIPFLIDGRNLYNVMSDPRVFTFGKWLVIFGFFIHTVTEFLKALNSDYWLVGNLRSSK